MSVLRSNEEALSRLLNLQRDIERFFGQPFFGGRFSVSGTGVYPPLNVFEQDDALYVVAELPGLSKESIDVEVKGESLALQGERKVRPAADGGLCHRRERSGGQFRRVINLPYPVDAEKASATYTDGVLTVRLEKADSAKPRRITVEPQG